MNERTSRASVIVTIVLAVLILVPSMVGFAAKFFEFVATFQEDPSGAFAITPMTNYLLASAGFFLLLLWAVANGMFHDIEKPKYDMLEQERRLDEHGKLSN